MKLSFGNDGDGRPAGVLNRPGPDASRSGIDARAPRDAGDDRDEVIGVNGFRDVHLKSREQRLADVILMREGREGDRRQVAGEQTAFPHEPDQVVSILNGHGDVAEENLRLDGGDDLECFDDGAGGGGGGAGVDKDFDEEIACVGFIVDDEDAQAVERGESSAAEGVGGSEEGTPERLRRTARRGRLMVK